MNGPLSQALQSAPDEVLTGLLREDIASWGGPYAIGDPEIFAQIYRWPQALPEFEVGHFHRLQAFANRAIERGGPIVYAGDYLGGPFIEGAIVSGEAAAARLLTRL